MEKSSLNAATTRTMPASSTAAKVAIPARRAVSPIGPEAGCLLNNSARRPTTKEYALRPSANMSAQLPIVDIQKPHSMITVFFQRSGWYANHHALGSAVHLLASRPDASQFVLRSLSGNAKDNQFQIKSTNAL